jgi:hypothetical protein
LLFAYQPSTQFDPPEFPLNLENLGERDIVAAVAMVLSFTLSEEGVAILHDALACMFKFSDDVCLEAKNDKVRLMRLHRSSMHPQLAYTFRSVDPHDAQHLQVGLYMLYLCSQPLLLTLSL